MYKKAMLVLLVFLCLFTWGCSGEVEDNAIDVDDGANGDEPVTTASWTDSPALEMIPDAPLQGEANGVEFLGKAVFFEPSFGKWQLTVADVVMDSPTGLVTEGQRIYISLPEVPESGQVFIREMEYGDGYFQIRQKDDPDSTTSWNTDNAYAIEITDWNVAEWDPDSDMFQQAGTASGRVFICFSGEGWDNFDNSWVAGTFTNVPVRYMGEPSLDY